MQKKTLQTSFASRIADFEHVLVSFDEDIAKPCFYVNAVKLGKDCIYHITNLGVMVVDHGVFKRLQKVFLKLEVWQFLFLQEPHRELTKRIQSENSNMRVVVAANLRSTSEW
jgi:hypothetical protein